MLIPTRLLASLLVLLLSLPVAAQSPKEQAARLTKAQTLMQVSGAAGIADQTLTLVTRQMEELLAAQNPGREAEITSLVRDHFTPFARAALPELSRGIVALYATHFTAAELDQMIAFYRTPAGRKAVSLMPMIIQQSMALGQGWAADVADKAWNSFSLAVKERGLALPRQL